MSINRRVNLSHLTPRRLLLAAALAVACIFQKLCGSALWRREQRPGKRPALSDGP